MVDQNSNQRRHEPTAADRLLSMLANDKRKLLNRFSIPGAADAFEKFYRREVYLSGCEYIQSSELSDCIRKIGEWLENPHATKGLMLAGVPGNGKTTALSAIQKIISVSGQMDKNEEDYYGNPTPCHLFSYKAVDLLNNFTNEKEFLKFKRHSLVAIDDFGCEPLDVFIFGNLFQPIISMLEYRYSNRMFTVLTTNLTPPEIKEKYGERIADRFREMMTVIPFPDLELRKNSKP